jgi:hypothetical protein
MLRILRSPRLRSLALMVQVAAVFCQLVEGTGRQHCPHHDLPAPAASAAMVHGAGHQHHQDHDRNHSCRCLGDCSTAFTALASRSPTPPRIAGDYRLPILPRLGAIPPAPQYRLPPSIGPPRSA